MLDVFDVNNVLKRLLSYINFVLGAPRYSRVNHLLSTFCCDQIGGSPGPEQGPPKLHLHYRSAPFEGRCTPLYIHHNKVSLLLVHCYHTYRTSEMYRSMGIQKQFKAGRCSLEGSKMQVRKG